MQPFRYEKARDADAASIAVRDGQAEFLAGGTDMLQLLKDGVRTPRRLVDITALPGLAGIEASASGLTIGALARMSDVAEHPDVARDYPAIAQALLASASPQIRNMATIGGNLLQRTRCVYFRDVSQACNKRAPGSGCAAIDGENRLHAVLGGSPDCVATHPSDLAVALVALDAVVATRGPQGTRRIPLEGFHRLPGSTPQEETMLEPGELIVAIEIPAAPAARRSVYRKQRDRASFEFALTSVAAALDLEGGSVRDVRIALGGVGTKPWRARDAEQALIGATPSSESFEAAATRALAQARPLEHNGFKVELAHAAICRALQTLIQAEPWQA
jgi:xanthine dehydrogenase YagS FAD-binding subunit